MIRIGEGAQFSFGPPGAEPLAISGSDVVFGSPEGVGPGKNLTRFVSSIELTPQVRAPHLKKGDRVQVVFDGQETHWLVTDVDDNGNGTLERIPE